MTLRAQKGKNCKAHTPLQKLEHFIQASHFSFSIFPVCFIQTKKESPFHTNDSSIISPTRKEGFCLAFSLYDGAIQITNGNWFHVFRQNANASNRQTKRMEWCKQITCNTYKNECDFSIPPWRLFTCRFNFYLQREDSFASLIKRRVFLILR